MCKSVLFLLCPVIIKPVTNLEGKMRKKRTSVVHRICTLVGSLFCFILIPLLLINCTLIIKSITNKNEVPDIGGIFPMVILTDSMNPQLASGDLVICRKVNAKNIKTGDVICFYDPEGNGTATVTHRVTELSLIHI